MIVEVFKTNVHDMEISKKLVRQLLDRFPDNLVNFDMEDCDKVLRVEGRTIIPEKIIEILNANGYCCEVLL
jgi:hypothetical protein